MTGVSSIGQLIIRQKQFKYFEMNKKLKYSIAIGFLFIIGLTAYCFLFGKLFPYSPIITGFSKIESEKTVIYIQNGAEYHGLKDMDSFLPFVEDFHDLKYLKKPRIFIFKDKKSFYQRSIAKTRACTYYNGDIVISPLALKEAENGKISLDIYLKHELSHSLLHQYSGIIRASQYPAWLLEGIAVYSSNQMGTSWYPSKEETYNYIRKGNFLPPEYFRTKKQDQIKLDVKHRMAFVYSEFACIVDYLIKLYGKDKFLSYMKEFTVGNKHDNVFKRIYKIEFNKCIQDFRESIMRQT